MGTDRGYSGKVTPSAQLGKKPQVCCLWRMIFSDLSPIISKARRTNSLELEDVWGSDTTALQAFNEFEKHWAVERSKPKPKLRRAMFKLARSRVLCSMFLSFVVATLELAFPLLINQIIRIVEYKKRGICDNLWMASNIPSGRFLNASLDPEVLCK